MRTLPRPSPRFLAIAGFMLAADLVLIGLYAIHKLDLTVDPAHALGADSGYAEVFQCVKTYWVGLGAGWLAWRTRQPVFGALAVLFLGLLIDDVGMLHETWGLWLSVALGLPSVIGLRPEDLGEVLFLTSWVGPTFVLGIWAYTRSGPHARRLARVALGGIGALAVFGVGVDLFHQILMGLVEMKGLDSVMTLIEEGGEMAVMSGIVAGTIATVLATLRREEEAAQAEAIRPMHDETAVGDGFSASDAYGPFVAQSTGDVTRAQRGAIDLVPASSGPDGAHGREDAPRARAASPAARDEPPA